MSEGHDPAATQSRVASVALADFGKLPVHPVRRLTSWLIHGEAPEWVAFSADDQDAYRAAPPRGKEPGIANPAISRAATALGLKYVGVAEERGLFIRIRKDVWLEPERTVQLHSRHRRFRDHAPHSVYHFSTYFQDGSCVLTWSHPPQTPSTDRLASRAGTGDLGRDLDDHRAATKDWAAQRETEPLVIDGPSAVAGLIDHYYRYVVPKSAAASFLLGLLLLPLMIAAAVLVAWIYAHR